MASTHPRVSVITATYNYSSVLRCAIESVRWQTFRDWEYLIIGDACTDDSADVVASFGDARLRWHNLPTNSGSQSAPNNKGIELARGDYIAYLGHDDLWTPDHLQQLVRSMDESGADWATSLGIMVGPPGSGAKILNGLVESETDPSNAWFLPSTSMHTRALASKIGAWHEYRTIDIGPDVEFRRRAIAAGARFAHIDNVTCFKFPSAWRKNVYRERPSIEQETYLERIRSEPHFIENELVEAYRTLQFRLWEKWFAQSDIPDIKDPAAPRGARVEAWRRYRGLPPNELTPRSRRELLTIKTRRVLADLTRPLRMAVRRLKE